MNLVSTPPFASGMRTDSPGPTALKPATVAGVAGLNTSPSIGVPGGSSGGGSGLPSLTITGGASMRSFAAGGFLSSLQLAQPAFAIVMNATSRAPVGRPARVARVHARFDSREVLHMGAQQSAARAWGQSLQS